MTDVPEPVRAFMSFLLDQGFSKTREEAHQSFGNVEITFERSDIVLKIIRDREVWLFEVYEPTDLSWSYDPAILHDFLSNSETFVRMDLQERITFLSDRLPDVAKIFDGPRSQASQIKLREMQQARALWLFDRKGIA